VRAFAHDVTGRLFLEFYDGGKRTRRALGHYDREAAKAKAEELAAALRRPKQALIAAATVQTLFDIYVREVTPTKSKGAQGHDRRAARLFLQCFGTNRRAETLNRRDWDRFIEWRRDLGDGRGGKVKGQPIGDRIIESDLRFLQAVLNWATTARDEHQQVLLVRNPLKRMPWPKEQAPRRPTLSDEQIGALKDASRSIHPLFALAVVLAFETGHRINAILKLRWSDVHFDRRAVRWRAENDKIGLEHETPASEVALQALQEARTKRPAIGDVWVFPSPSDSSKPCSRHLAKAWWRRGEKAAGIPRDKGLGWHAFRRKFASDLKHTPLVDLTHLGGWKDAQTVVKHYQEPDEKTLRNALANRHRESTPKEKTGTNESPA
jgi:integrase